MALGDSFRSNEIKQGSPLGMLTKTVLLTADNTAVDVRNYRKLDLSSDNTTAANRTFTLVASPLVGHEITIVFTSGSSTTAQLADTGTQKLTGTWEPVQYDTITLLSDGTNWIEMARGSVTSGITTIALTSAHVLVGNGSNLAADVAVSGVIALDNTGATTFAAGAVDNAAVSASAAIAFSKLATLTSGNVLVGSAGNVPTSVAMAGDVTIVAAGTTAIGAAKVTTAMLKPTTTAGLHAKRLAYGVLNPTATAGDRTVAPHDLGATIPDNAFVTNVFYWVETTLTSATDAATVALSIEAANDVTVAIAISDGSNPWDTTAKPVEGIPKLETTSTWLATTAARAVTATVGVEALLLGKLHVWVEYVEFA